MYMDSYTRIDHKSITEGLYVYALIYTVKSLYNDVIILQKKIGSGNYVCLHFISGSYSNLPMFPVWSPAINLNDKKARALTGSTFGIYSQIRSGMQPKQ